MNRARRIKELLTVEREQPLRWFWLSFCDLERPRGEQFLGACLVEARGVLTATLEARNRGFNPGGEVRAVELPSDRVVPAAWANRLLTKAEAESEELNSVLGG